MATVENIDFQTNAAELFTPIWPEVIKILWLMTWLP